MIFSANPLLPCLQRLCLRRVFQPDPLYSLAYFAQHYRFPMMQGWLGHSPTLSGRPRQATKGSANLKTASSAASARGNWRREMRSYLKAVTITPCQGSGLPGGAKAPNRRRFTLQYQPSDGLRLTSARCPGFCRWRFIHRLKLVAQGSVVTPLQTAFFALTFPGFDQVLEAPGALDRLFAAFRASLVSLHAELIFPLA